MSYASIGSVGLGIVAKGVAGCVGGEVGEDLAGNPIGPCCALKDWGAATYKKIKGQESWRYQNEARIKKALGALLAPGSVRTTRLGDYAYQLGPTITVQNGLEARIATALANFDQLFPTSRWTVKKNARPGLKYPSVIGELPACGFYDAWVSNRPPASAERAALLSNLSKVQVSPELLSELYLDMPIRHVLPAEMLPPGMKHMADTTWVKAPDKLYAWAQALQELVSSVPGPGNYRGGFDRVPPIAELVGVGGDQVVAGPWLSSLLAMLAPTFVVSPALAKLIAMKGKQSALLSHSAALAQAVTASQAKEDEPSDGGTMLMVAGAIALIGIAGGAAYLYARRS